MGVSMSSSVVMPLGRLPSDSVSEAILTVECDGKRGGAFSGGLCEAIVSLRGAQKRAVGD